MMIVSPSLYLVCYIQHQYLVISIARSDSAAAAGAAALEGPHRDEV